MDFVYWLLVLAVSLSVLLAVYVWYMSLRFEETRNLGFDGPKPRLVVGNVTKEGMIRQQVRLYREFKDKKVIGYYMARWPCLIVQDLDVIRDIMVKNFHCFTNHTYRAPTGTYMDYFLTRLRDDHWKHVRSMVSPTFSTGKLKLMSKHMERSSQLLLDNLTEKLERNEPVELKETMSCFAMDVIAAAGFGMEINSLKDPQNRFAVAAQKIVNMSTDTLVLNLFFSFLVPLMHVLGIKSFDKNALDSFTQLIEKAIQSRSQESQHDQALRKDFLQLLINAKYEHVTEHDGSPKEEQEALKTDNSRKGLSDPEIYAQAIMFFLGSYAPLASGLSFTLFLLTVHPEALKKVQEELDKQLNGTRPGYDNIQSLNYLDMCINEALRMFPVAVIMDRTCAQEVEIQGMTFPENYILLIPVYAIHHDPDLWPNPETFDPERFSPENRAGRHPYAHMPFGHGPRNCVGMRLAMLEMKILLATILQQLTPVVCQKTVYPPRLHKVKTEALDGLWVSFEKRTSN